MPPVFELNHAKLAADPRYLSLATELAKLSPIDSEASFNRYCREAYRLWPGGNGESSSRFAELLLQLQSGGPNVITTSWGGVVITLHQPPRVEKFLIIHGGGYLALEKHAEKDERLEVREGTGLILWRQANEQALTVEVLRPGAGFHLRPGHEHCLVGTEKLLVFERSTDPKGMDQDLIFIYSPAQS